jgi:cytochrome P450
MSFGAGQRICLGASFAMTEANDLFASLVRAARFD